MLHKSITEAKAKLPELINLVDVKSERVVIRKHNVPVAVIIPFSQMPQHKKKIKKLNITLKELEETPSVFDEYVGLLKDLTDEEVENARFEYLKERYLK